MSDIIDIYPLTPMQEGMLFHHLYDIDKTTYNVQIKIVLEGKLNLKLAEESYKIIINRYDILRTAIMYEKLDRARQIVLKKRQGRFSFIDTSAYTAEKRSRVIEETLEKDITEEFNLTHDILFRMLLIREEQEKFQLIITNHHIIMDGWSLGIIIRDFFKTYESLVLKREQERNRIYPFVHYMKWLMRQDKEQGMEYWKKYLKNYDTVVEIPGNAKKEKVKKYDSKELRFSLSKPLTFRLESTAKDLGVTTGNILQVVLGIILMKYNYTRDVVFGCVVSGRSGEIIGINKMVGLCINTIPLRIKANADDGFNELVKIVHLDFIESNRFSFVSLGEIQKRVLNNSDMINQLFVFENYPLEQSLIGDGLADVLRITDLDGNEQTNFKFNFKVMPGNELLIKLAYDRNVLDDEFIARMSNHIYQILETIANNPKVAVGDIDILSESEKHKILYHYNATTLAYPENLLIHEIFEKKTARYPERTALIDKNRILTYQQLNEEANQLARGLLEKRIQQGSIIGVMLDRSIEMVISILAILKCGCAYLPIDPAFPEERVAFLLTDSNAALLLCSRKYYNTVQSYPIDTELVDVDDPIHYYYSSENLQVKGHLDQNLYIVYTSGSTGVPKGVLISHRVILNSLFAMEKFYSLDSQDAYLFKTTFTFDVSTSELFGWFMGKGKLVILEPECEKEPADILNYIKQHGITHVNFIPSMLEILLDEYGVRISEYVSSLKYVFVAGEEFTEALALKSKKVFSNAAIVNIYGPSETFYTTHYNLQEWGEIDPVPIGKPFPNLNIYILDPFENLVPVEIPGELCVTGDGLANGYLNRKELTDRRFIPNPIDSEEKMYYTGDLSKWNIDGNIIYLGRIDQQIKIRGFRIETGEIEAFIKKYPGIHTVAVVGLKGENNNKSLYAYIVCEKKLLKTKLEEYLKKKLPSYMIPARFIELDEMPLTSNGKINKRALPKPKEDISTYVEYEPPGNDLQLEIVNIFKDVLELEKVSINDDFFNLGGHSLKAISIVMKMNKIFNIEIRINHIFQMPTVKELSSLVESKLSGEDQGDNKSKKYPLIPINRDEELKLSFGQQIMWFLYQFEPDNPYYNMPCSLLIKGIFNPDLLEKSIQYIIDRHEVLRTVFIEEDNKPSLRICDQLSFHINLEDLSDLDKNEKKETAEKMAYEEAMRPFHLENPPLIRVTGLKLQDTEHVMLITMHHIISDGFSIDIFFRELSCIYNSLLNQKPIPLKALPVQFADYAAWQRSLFDNDILEDDLQYWVDKLQNTPNLELPYDRKPGKETSLRGASLEIIIDKEITKKLNRIKSEQKSTTFIVLLTIYAILLYRYTDQIDVVIGTVVANRHKDEIKELIGFFANSLALRTDVSGDLRFTALLARVKRVVLEAFHHQEVPFDKIIERLNPERKLHASPIYQTVFSLQNVSLSCLNLDNVESSVFIDNSEFIVKYDTELHIWDKGDTLEGFFHYKSDLFDEVTIMNMRDDFILLAKSISEQGQEKITELLSAISSSAQGRAMIDTAISVEDTLVDDIDDLSDSDIDNLLNQLS